MDTTTSVSSPTITEIDLLSYLIQHAVDNQFSVAVWRLPNNNTRHIILSRQHEKLKTDITLEELPTGFIFAPFDTASERIYLKADFSFSFTDDGLNEPVTPLEITSSAWLQAKRDEIKKRKAGYYHIQRTSGDTQKDAYLNVVALGIAETEKETFQKVVPSRSKAVTLPPDFDIVNAFMKLCAGNPNALISFVSTPETGSWLGATPEMLVNVEGHTIFKTVALAGTQPYREGMNLKSVAWTQKDIEEQALVERYIISCFKRIRLREYDEHGPKTVVAGNLLHLKSEFTVDMQATDFLQLGTTMLQLLHPTSAVCGMPLNAALDFLRKHEGYDRQFYAGFLGPVNFKNNIHIFVNLRCAQLLESQAVLYAGAGVTIDSVPEQEWEETEIKMNTLLNVISPVRPA
ncbi:chorismate-binding protein [Chryseolinea lacunae]|uniref:Chorismate-binding protein n=1 Tax=Chryseolinea lacunae TaxID=2801331 RepID=A0ABS1KWZ3_9BACT|nr:chorismate-binding protein [Chryseolinea lacunae]MBL0743742.1 chorismate-binding protein [Chryseolinea lacunae]